MKIRLSAPAFGVYSAVLGFLLAGAGVALDNRPLVWAAMVLLGAALAIRLVLRRRGS